MTDTDTIAYALLAAGLVSVFVGAAYLTDQIDRLLTAWLAGPIDLPEEDEPDDDEDGGVLV